MKLFGFKLGVTMVLGAWGMMLGAPLFGAPAVPSVSLPTGPTALLPFPTNTPVTFFRQLLAMSPEQQEVRLASRSPANRVVIERKLTEYQSLPVEERDARLRAMEFHHYMTALLRAPSSLRSNWLAQVPAEFQRSCEERLRLWVVLPPEIQQYLLERQSSMQWITRLQGMTENERRQALANLPPVERQSIEADVARWQSMSQEQRDQTWRGVRQMFDLSPREQQRVLSRVAQTQRPQTEKLVQNLNPLTPLERERYVEGWRKFSQLDPAHRAKFIQGWERWKTMPESEREVWRRLSARIPAVPPLPAPTSSPATSKNSAWGQPGHGMAAR